MIDQGIISRPASAAAPARPQTPPGRRHTVLIVDDEPDVLDSLRHLFHRRYRVLTADGGREGLELLGSEDVHIILSDQRMPGMTGDQFLKNARECSPDAIRLWCQLSAARRAGGSSCACRLPRSMRGYTMQMGCSRHTGSTGTMLMWHSLPSTWISFSSSCSP